MRQHPCPERQEKLLSAQHRIAFPSHSSHKGQMSRGICPFLFSIFSWPLSLPLSLSTVFIHLRAVLPTLAIVTRLIPLCYDFISTIYSMSTHKKGARLLRHPTVFLYLTKSIATQQFQSSFRRSRKRAVFSRSLFSRTGILSDGRFRTDRSSFSSSCGYILL